MASAVESVPCSFFRSGSAALTVFVTRSMVQPGKRSRPCQSLPRTSLRKRSKRAGVKEAPEAGLWPIWARSWSVKPGWAESSCIMRESMTVLGGRAAMSRVMRSESPARVAHAARRTSGVRRRRWRGCRMVGVDAVDSVNVASSRKRSLTAPALCPRKAFIYLFRGSFYRAVPLVGASSRAQLA